MAIRIRGDAPRPVSTPVQRRTAVIFGQAAETRHREFYVPGHLKTPASQVPASRDKASGHVTRRDQAAGARQAGTR